MMSRGEVKELLGHAAERILSVYLNVDQSKAVNINRHFETSFESMQNRLEAGLTKPEREALARDAAPARAFLSSYAPAGKGLVIFSDASEGFFWTRAFKLDVPNRLLWEPAPYVRPLVEMFDEYERYGVALADKLKARVFSVFLGEIEERIALEAPLPVRHFKGTSWDRARSQNLQRKSEGHALEHLKSAADAVRRLYGRRRFSRLILAGPEDARKALKRFLPAELKPLTVQELALPADTSETRMLEETLKVERRIEREKEAILVRDLVTMASKRTRQAVLGLEPVLNAAAKGQVGRLVYARSTAASPPEGAACEACRSLFTELPSRCPYCGATVRPEKDLLERLVETVIARDGDVEEVREAGRAEFRRARALGAFLRFPIMNKGGTDDDAIRTAEL